MPSPAQWLIYQINSFSKRLTLGVRGMVMDRRNRIFLVRHTYVPGWYMPGGGVEPGETLEEALARELWEEGNIVMSGEPSLHGMFLNKALSNRDHVAVFIVREFEQTAKKTADLEILEADFFDLDHLPEATTAPTRRRLAEIFDGVKLDRLW
jgi:8-oxo-dGTP pyrophosphatase MutT (NUDIX family)